MARRERLTEWMNERLGALVLDPVSAPEPSGELVVGLDGTDESLNAAEWADALGSVAHAVYARRHGQPGEGATPEGLEALVEEARSAFAMADQDMPASVQQHVFDASTSEAMSQVAEAVNADAILVGPHVGESLKVPGLAAQVQQLLHVAPRPVLLTNQRPNREPVLVALGDDPSTRFAARWAVHAAIQLEVPLVAVHAAPEDLERMDLDEFEAKGPRAEARLLDGEPNRAILDEIENVEPSVAVIGHGRYHSPPGSTALTVAQATDTSTLVVPFGRE